MRPKKTFVNKNVCKSRRKVKFITKEDFIRKTRPKGKISIQITQFM